MIRHDTPARKGQSIEPKSAREALLHFLRGERKPIDREQLLVIVPLVARFAGYQEPEGGWVLLLDQLIAEGMAIESNGLVSLDREETERKEAKAAGFLF
ncbi:hypothetical protein [Roseiconus lacunae]|uniref:hypothetical protein n=1 Tax=Roseiconus lacunae TaxID=2605694 RepID=UPI001E5DB948|nr:hypothetical protein [Roseiconus lacunae]MCD0460033.1 hypothetical protein [Roseiconus lacunae]